MKASASLLILFLVAAGCSDATNVPTRLSAPTSAAERGNVPPPPADVAVAVCTDGGCAVFDGSYMSNGELASALSVPMSLASFSPIAAQGDGVCTFPGQAFLKIDEPLESDVFEDLGATSANAQIKCHQGIATGNGTIQIGAVVVDFDRVAAFNNQPDCTFSCGQFVVRDEDDNVIATGIIIEREAFEDARCFISGGDGEPTVPVCYEPGSGEG